jgi:hypothetical protein
MKVAGVVALVVLVASVAGCGSSTGSAGKTSSTSKGAPTLLNMTYLAESIKAQTSAKGGKWEPNPYSVTCTKTAALEAKCVERYKPYSGEAQGEVDESVEIAPDGQTYGA